MVRFVEVPSCRDRIHVLFEPGLLIFSVIRRIPFERGSVGRGGGFTVFTLFTDWIRFSLRDIVTRIKHYVSKKKLKIFSQDIFLLARTDVVDNRVRAIDRRRRLSVFTIRKRRVFIRFEHTPFSRGNYTRKPVTYVPRRFRDDNNNLHPSRYRTPVECTWHPSSDSRPPKSLDYIIITWAAANGTSYDCDIIAVKTCRLSSVSRRTWPTDARLKVVRCEAVLQRIRSLDLSLFATIVKRRSIDSFGQFKNNEKLFCFLYGYSVTFEQHIVRSQCLYIRHC